MSLLVEAYIFYMDVYILQNFFLKTIVLYLSLYVNKQLKAGFKGKRIVRIIAVALIGTMLEMICLLLMDSYAFYLFFSHIVELPISIWILTKGEKRERMKIIVTGYLFTIIVNGVLEILWNYGGRNGSYLFFIIVTGAIVLFCVLRWKRDYKEQKGVYPTKLFGEDRELEIMGLYDSGNRLKDPYTQKGVHIVSEQVIQSLGLEEQGYVWVPYTALGNEQGLMKVYYIDKVQIFFEENCIEQQKIPIGRATDGLFEKKPYEIILNEEVF